MIIYLGKIRSGEKQFAKLNKQKKFYPQNPVNSGVWPERLFLFDNFGYFSQLSNYNINNINKITIRWLSNVAPLNCARHVILIWTHVLSDHGSLSRGVPWPGSHTKLKSSDWWPRLPWRWWRGGWSGATNLTCRLRWSAGYCCAPWL